MTPTDGKAFEREVLRVLQLHGWQVSPEILIGHKKVDICATKRDDLGQVRRIGVECKDYATVLTSSDISRIYADYLPLIQQNHISLVLVVTSGELSPAARAFAESAAGLIHLTFEGLLRSLMDFASYVQNLVNDYSADTVSKYYIQQWCEFEEEDVATRHIWRKSALIEHAILDWVASAEVRPMAVLGSYGIGKTTLARRLCYILGDQWSSDNRRRLPILIKLEDIATDQTLEGLLGRYFTSVHVVPNFNFHTFMKLNSAGNLVILLDGFDEMKRTMSWHAMRYNFEQINRLVLGRSKVLILGRPTAFLTDAEMAEALHGTRQILNRERTIPNAPNYIELHLLPFKTEQIVEFSKKYLEISKQSISNLGGSAKNFNSFIRRLEENGADHLRDLATRPVQLKMLLEILPYYDGTLDSLDKTVLYSEFVDLVIRREVSKKERQSFSEQVRRAFAVDLAFWMWANGRIREVASTRLPDELFTKYSAAGDLDGVKRDLLSACLLERKQADHYYFAHASLQEYLVSEKLVSLITSQERTLYGINFLTPEVKAFALSGIGRRDVRKWKESIPEWAGRISKQCLELFVDACKVHNVEFKPEFVQFLESGEQPATNKLADSPFRRTEDAAPISWTTPRVPHRKSGATRKKDWYK